MLKQATASSIPKFKSEVFVRQLHSREWSSRINDAIKKSRLVWWDWRKAGSPTDPEHPTVECRKRTEKALAKEQRQEAANKRTEKVEEIMNSRNDQKVFYKLIKNQRKSSNSQLHLLVVNNRECEIKDEIRQGMGNPFSNTLRRP